ncbi:MULTISPECIES: DEAD/DEAH box helicase [unclassified Leifsonia]|uniref:DEAD/DEAH box helicase n=1 Tax=unclassified Leifsonia TaxID=2663824 RepID=UPI0006FAE9FB|nr:MULTISPECIES: DEAD/DEAH box helicase [unclassified Leifsonia]KQX07525.1 DEAD/DEAH box helicase [Leifsonia sp. Root1293]KRA11807.1 DEAD/DEAH box helicase [Leifsonia sp. Root60]
MSSDARPLLDRLPESTDADAIFEAFEQWAVDSGLTLYPAQEEALIEIVSGANLILSTPTGTGKSLVAVGAHFAAMAAGSRSFYTAPIKALVSEKFFALVDVFGAANVGMMTGDSAVNPDAPIICCTAEILANQALRHGEDTEADVVIMDEFHFYADQDRGWAWQVPLLLLSRAQFVLMSATLGDTSEIAADLTRRTDRDTASVTGVERPVPLSYYYETTPVHETIDDLLQTNRAPVYIVHFSQAAALERAQALASAKIASREQRDEIAELIAEFRFTTAFGKTLSRLIRMGIGVHHAGMLPKYRRLVETLAQRGLLRVICGTDTLGVGINVPIRTVLLTALTKYDGQRMRQLTAREFHQIAGRAGRAGYDTTGTVVAQAPEHESENLKAIEKAGDDPKKKRKIIRKKAPDGFVSWGEPSFRKLIDAEPEALRSHMQMTSAMLINVIARGGDVFENVRTLVFDNHEPWKRRLELARRALGIYRTLRASGIVTQDDGVIRLAIDLEPNFALNQPLSPFALEAFELIEPESPSYALDIISVLEATLDDPRAILSQQQFVARGEAVAAMKSEGIEYEERMELLEDITHPRPLADLLGAAYETYAAVQPWVRDFALSPKSVVRDMYERAMSFGEFIAFYRLARSEGVVLRYLSDAYRTARQTIPLDLRTEDLTDLIEWLGELVRQVDSSLLDEWNELAHPDAAVHHALETAVVPPAPSRLTTNIRAFRVLVRNELFRRVQLAAREDYPALDELDAQHGFDAAAWTQALDGYFTEYDAIGIGPHARSSALLVLDESSRVWTARQIFDDPDGDHDWAIEATVDLDASDDAGEAVIRVTRVGPHSAR